MMKPYSLVIHNRIKFFLKTILFSSFKSNGIQMFSRNLKLCIKKTSSVEFEKHIVSDGRIVIVVGENAKLFIGERVYFNEDAMISCKCNISIGAGCKFGPNVKIFDNNHKFNAEQGVLDTYSSGNIRIGENCWIGSNVVILKGTNIGKNSVIGAGCVISGDIPEASVVTQGRDICVSSMKK